MGRPKAFDEDAVLDRAVELFRNHGYAALGVAELTDALGLSRSSLYALRVQAGPVAGSAAPLPPRS